MQYTVQIIYKGRTIRKVMGGRGGAGEVQKKNSRKGKKYIYIQKNISEACKLRDGPLEKLWGGGRGIFESQEFFFVIKFVVWIFFRPWHEYFLGLIGMQEFFFI